MSEGNKLDLYYESIIAKLELALSRKTEALEKYGRHKGACELKKYQYRLEHKCKCVCSCGLDDAKRGTR